MDDDGPLDKDGERAGKGHCIGDIAGGGGCTGGIAGGRGCRGGCTGDGVGGGIVTSGGACPERIIATSRASNALRKISFSDIPVDTPAKGGTDCTEGGTGCTEGDL